MHILRIDPEPPGYGGVLARVSVAISDDCRLYGLKLVERPDGRRLLFAPQAGGARVATFSPKMTAEIVRAAGVALLEAYALDRTCD